MNEAILFALKGHLLGQICPFTQSVFQANLDINWLNFSQLTGLNRNRCFDNKLTKEPDVLINPDILSFKEILILIGLQML